jgi:deoxyribodipyrimidine photolyase-related protein
MSNHCSECRYRPELASGEQACPFTSLYYSFLDRHRERFADNRRMTFQLKNLERKSTEELAQIRARETELRAKWGGQEESDD